MSFCFFQFEKCFFMMNRKVTNNLEGGKETLLDSMQKKRLRHEENWKAEKLLECINQCKLSEAAAKQKWRDKDEIKAEMNLFIHHYSRHSIIFL